MWNHVQIENEVYWQHIDIYTHRGSLSLKNSGTIQKSKYIVQFKLECIILQVDMHILFFLMCFNKLVAHR